MKQGGVLRDHRNRGLQTVEAHLGDVLTRDVDTSTRGFVEVLDQGEDGRFTGARWANQSDTLAGPDLQVQAIEHRPTAGVREGHVPELDRGVAHLQHRRVVVLRHLVRCQQDGRGLAEAGHVLCEVYESHGQIARPVQDGKAERTDQHHIAGGGAIHTPKP